MLRNQADVFDGNPDGISRIEIKYHRMTKIKPQIRIEDVNWDYITWDYKERLQIDRASETIEHERRIGSGCTVKNIYHVEDGISSFLDSFDEDVLGEPEGNPPDVVENPLETKDYVITVQTKHGDIRTIKGTFDKYGLPEDWEEFITDLYDFMAFYGFGEIFEPSVYGKEKRRKSDYIFCNVQFAGSGTTYCYLADSDNYDEGDLVVVPAGNDNREVVVRIDSVEYHSAEDAPYPFEKIKHILRKYEPEPEECQSNSEDAEREIAVTSPTIIMGSEPAPDMLPDDVRAKYGNTPDEKHLADAFALAHNQFWWVEDSIYDYEEGTPEYRKACALTEKWGELMDDYEAQIFDILEKEGVEIPQTGRIAVLKPFMDRNGYVDGSGWWIPKSEYDR